MSDVTSAVEARLALPAHVEVPYATDTNGREVSITAVMIQHTVTVWDDGYVVRTTVVFDAESDNISFHALTDLPYGLPDAPQWFLDAAEVMGADR